MGITGAVRLLLAVESDGNKMMRPDEELVKVCPVGRTRIVLMILAPLADGQDMQFTVGQYHMSSVYWAKGFISLPGKKGKETDLDWARRGKCRVDCLESTK